MFQLLELHVGGWCVDFAHVVVSETRASCRTFCIMHADNASIYLEYKKYLKAAAFFDDGVDSRNIVIDKQIEGVVRNAF